MFIFPIFIIGYPIYPMFIYILTFISLHWPRSKSFKLAETLNNMNMLRLIFLSSPYL